MNIGEPRRIILVEPLLDPPARRRTGAHGTAGAGNAARARRCHPRAASSLQAHGKKEGGPDAS